MVNDNYRDRHERYRRKRGSLPIHSVELSKLISERTRLAMANPNIKSLLHKPRRPLTIARRHDISNRLAGKMPSNMFFGNSAYPNVQRGDYDINGRTFYFRSKWEANYALYLDFLVKQRQILKWEYEADKFIFDKIQFGTRSYMPDFKITNADGTIEYHEVKGYMDGRSRTKLRRMKRYYPNVKIILIDTSFYKDLKKKVGAMLNFY